MSSRTPSILAGCASINTSRTEAAEELVGPYFLRGVGYSPVLENKGENPIFNGYIPALNFPIPGPKEWTPLAAFHIDGLHTS